VPIRVIGGTAKGRKLKMVPGDSTRPVMARVKEALFNILGSGITKSIFLDLFAGTGSVGIEALSRGAAQVTFIDNSRVAIRTIHENLAITELADRAVVLRRDALDYLATSGGEAYEFIYVAPPQYQGLWKAALLTLDANPDRLLPDGLVIVQIDPHEQEDVKLERLQPYDERTYGNTLLWFFELPVPD
jgi:16S rRNA (guanine966-N2)-methyltransferase